MNKKITLLLLMIITLGGLFFSCEEENYNNSDSAKLAFSTDTVMFDTIFTTIGSTTKAFTVKNNGFLPIKVSDIKLAGGDNSPYRLNIDGEMVNEVKDYEIRGNDSIYIFVEVTIDPNGINQPLIVQDSIVFKVNGNTQDVDLIAFGQDFVLIKSETLNTTTWTAEKPYLVYDSVVVGKDQVLNIEAGARIFFHRNSYCRVWGAISAKGTPESPIIFKGDRLEHDYFDFPNQWVGIFISPSSTQSVFENVDIHGGMVGLDLGSLDDNGSSNVKLHNVRIEHMGFYGIRSVNSKIEATNTLISDCGQHCLFLLVGGDYSFNHCTIANYWNASTRKTPSVVIANYGKVDSIIYERDLVRADWKNSIIWGDNTEPELILSDFGHYAFNAFFDRCMVKINDSIFKANEQIFKEVIRSVAQDSLVFDDPDNYKFMPDTLSPVRNYGLRKYAEMLPFDLANISRLADEGPDIGAYEYHYVEKKKKD